MARRKAPGAKAAKKKNAARRVGFESQAARNDVHAGGSDQHGTAPGAMGIVKAASEEARHETCFECGYGGGRHGRMCSFYVPPAS